MEKPITFSDLWRIENAVWSAEDRILSIEIAFNVLLVALHEAGFLPRDRFERHLASATKELEQQAGDQLQGAVAALDALRHHCAALLTPRSAENRNI